MSCMSHFDAMDDLLFGKHDTNSLVFEEFPVNEYGGYGSGGNHSLNSNPCQSCDVQGKEHSLPTTPNTQISIPFKDSFMYSSDQNSVGNDDECGDEISDDEFQRLFLTTSALNTPAIQSMSPFTRTNTAERTDEVNLQICG
eukprot:TRINITY_DN69101_c0_g2_i1.p1 TRINITY_DN69101_c0_g2~~TRINITY_DN69101_c0_g2_i1.p1  ORF type:complete len:141 (+),score=46.16 TRINITY_DN69101_c0_g2_i1:186-608(+)